MHECVVSTCPSVFKNRKGLRSHYLRVHSVEELLLGGIEVWNHVDRTEDEHKRILRWLLANRFLLKPQARKPK